MMTTMIYDEYCNVLYRQLFAEILSCENQKSNVKVVVNSVCAAANVFSLNVCVCVCSSVWLVVMCWAHSRKRSNAIRDQTSRCVLSQLDHNIL